MSNVVGGQIDVSIEGTESILGKDREPVEMTPAGEYSDPYAPENQIAEDDIGEISAGVDELLQNLLSYTRRLKEEAISRIRH